MVSNLILVMWIVEYHKDQFWDLSNFCCILMISIGCDNVKSFTDDTFLFTNDRNIDAAKEKASNLFEKKNRWCVADRLSINSGKKHFVLFHVKNKPMFSSVCAPCWSHVQFSVGPMLVPWTLLSGVTCLSLYTRWILCRIINALHCMCCMWWKGKYS